MANTQTHTGINPSGLKPKPPAPITPAASRSGSLCACPSYHHAISSSRAASFLLIGRYLRVAAGLAPRAEPAVAASWRRASVIVDGLNLPLAGASWGKLRPHLGDCHRRGGQ